MDALKRKCLAGLFCPTVLKSLLVFPLTTFFYFHACLGQSLRTEKRIPGQFIYDQALYGGLLQPYLKVLKNQ
jgi:hypothetical protein